MSTDGDSWLPDGRSNGFTLIEVIGALVIFSVGVLMVMNVGSALTTRMRYSGARSQIVVLANERVDSVEAMPFSALTAGASEDTVMVQGWEYTRTLTITSLTPVLARVEVEVAPVGDRGPSLSVTSYTSDAW